MKAKFSISGMCILMIFLFSGCQKERDLSELNLNQGNARLKQILLFASVDSEEPISIVEEYEYDEKGRISRTSSPMYQDGVIAGTIKYDLYEYNSSDQLIKILNFNANLNSPTDFINLKNYNYTYSADGKKVKESIDYPGAGLAETFTYEYKNDQLVLIKKYDNKNELESYTKYQYDRSVKPIQESFYAYDDHCISYTNHTYSGILLIKSDVFQGDVHLREIKRTYDNNNNLITLESNELTALSSLMSAVLRYVYFPEN